MKLVFFNNLVSSLRGSAEYADYFPNGIAHGEEEALNQFGEKIEFPYGYYETNENIEEERDTSGATFRRQAVLFHYFTVGDGDSAGDEQGIEFSSWLQSAIDTFDVDDAKIQILDRELNVDFIEQESSRDPNGNIVWHTYVGYEFYVAYEA